MKSTPRGFEEHRPEILKDMSGNVDGRRLLSGIGAAQHSMAGRSADKTHLRASVESTVHRSCGGAARVGAAKEIGGGS